MSGEGTLMVRVAKQLDGDVVLNAVPVRIRRVDGKPLSPDRKVLRLAAPATMRDEWATSQLPAGRYEVEAILPSGEMLSGEADLGDGDQARIVLKGAPSGNEWRSWSHFSGLRDASQTALAVLGRKSDAAPLAPPDYSVSLGRIARETGRGAKFDAGEWDSWYTFLLRRWEARTASRPSDLDLEVTAADPELSFRIIKGYFGEPVMISVEGRDPYVPDEELGRERNFIAISSARGTRLISVPWPWRKGNATWNNDEFLNVLVSEDDRAMLCEATIRDERLGGVLAYLNAGRIGLAGELLELAYEALFAKFDNPLGAAAGGYVLLSTAESKRLRNWPHWLNNLANYFPNLPDGAILRARWLLDRSENEDTDEARDLLVSAYRRGIPFFTAGVPWLLEGLARVADGDPEIEKMLQTVRGVARSIDLSRGLTSFDLPALDLPGGRTRPAERAAPAVHEASLVAEPG